MCELYSKHQNWNQAINLTATQENQRITNEWQPKINENNTQLNNKLTARIQDHIGKQKYAPVPRWQCRDRMQILHS